MSQRKMIQPAWYEGELPPGSYRSLFKWGAPNQFKHPNQRMVALIREALGMSEEDFRERQPLGLEPVADQPASNLTQDQIEILQGMVGAENVYLDGYTRLRAAYGSAMIDALRLCEKIHENLPDAVLHPRHAADVEAVMQMCYREGIPLYVFGGRSSVTRGFEAVKGGISLDLSAHMKRIISFDETNQTITVEPGIFGPELEDALQHAPERFGAIRRYTCGHFPQSFEYSSVGGWVVTRGAGQNSTGYGKIEDIVLSQEYVTPRGRFSTLAYPRSACGPDLNQVMMGSEGAFGILVGVTLKVFRSLPQNRRCFSYLFHTWGEALEAVREVMQCQAGLPSVFRLSDPEETDVALKMYGIDGTPADSVLRGLGYAPMQRCLLLGIVEGERGYCRNLDRVIRKRCRKGSALELSLLRVAQRWEESRFRDPYMREDLHDFGVLIDTLECSVTWSQLAGVHQSVRALIHSQPGRICMTHLSHFYPQGANLYFIFITRKRSIHDYLGLQYDILEAIQRSGAAISHHHGLGKATSPWLAGQLGEVGMGVLHSLKEYFDPANTLNPGGTLGLDMNEAQRRKIWGIEEIK